MRFRRQTAFSTRPDRIPCPHSQRRWRLPDAKPGARDGHGDTLRRAARPAPGATGALHHWPFSPRPILAARPPRALVPRGELRLRSGRRRVPPSIVQVRIVKYAWSGLILG
jgi:hypothetical protein